MIINYIVNKYHITNNKNNQHLLSAYYEKSFINIILLNPQHAWEVSPIFIPFGKSKRDLSCPKF